MKVQKVGKWYSTYLFIGAFLFLGSVVVTPDFLKLDFFLTGLVVFQFVYSIVLYLSALKINSPEYINRYKVCCWVGVLYALLLGVWMWDRAFYHLPELGEQLDATLILHSIISVGVVAATSAPFIWSIKKLNAMEDVEN